MNHSALSPRGVAAAPAVAKLMAAELDWTKMRDIG